MAQADKLLMNKSYLCERTQNEEIMETKNEIRIGDWVYLKSDHTKEYNVRGISISKSFLDCLTSNGKRDFFKIEDIELITDKDRIDYLESDKDNYSAPDFGVG